MLNKGHKNQKLNDDEIIYDESADEDSGINTDQDRKVSKLKALLEKCHEDKQTYLDGWQRSKADYINFKNRIERESAELSKFIKSNIILEFLKPIDTFELAMKNKESWSQVSENWRIGVEHIYNELVTALENLGVSEISGIGEHFNHNLHEANETVITNDENKDGEVLEIILKGYKIGDIVIRPAKVKVAKFDKMGAVES